MARAISGSSSPNRHEDPQHKSINWASMKIRSRLNALILCLPAARLIFCPGEAEAGVNRVRKSCGGRSSTPSRATPGWLRSSHANETRIRSWEKASCPSDKIESIPIGISLHNGLLLFGGTISWCIQSSALQWNCEICLFGTKAEEAVGEDILYGAVLTPVYQIV